MQTKMKPMMAVSTLMPAQDNAPRPLRKTKKHKFPPEPAAQARAKCGLNLSCGRKAAVPFSARDLLQPPPIDARRLKKMPSTRLTSIASCSVDQSLKSIKHLLHPAPAPPHQ